MRIQHRRDIFWFCKMRTQVCGNEIKIKVALYSYQLVEQSDSQWVVMILTCHDLVGSLFSLLLLSGNCNLRYCACVFRLVSEVDCVRQNCSFLRCSAQEQEGTCKRLTRTDRQPDRQKDRQMTKHVPENIIKTLYTLSFWNKLLAS